MLAGTHWIAWLCLPHKTVIGFKLKKTISKFPKPASITEAQPFSPGHPYTPHQLHGPGTCIPHAHLLETPSLQHRLCLGHPSRHHKAPHTSACRVIVTNYEGWKPGLWKSNPIWSSRCNKSKWTQPVLVDTHLAWVYTAPFEPRSYIWGVSHIIHLPPQSRGVNMLSQTLLQLGCWPMIETPQLDVPQRMQFGRELGEGGTAQWDHLWGAEGGGSSPFRGCITGVSFIQSQQQ